MDLGDKIRQLRKQQGLSVRQLARRSGVSPSLISQVENKRGGLSLDSLKAIAGGLNTTLNSLIGTFKENYDGRVPGALPILGVIRAGEPLLAVQHIIGYLLPPKGIHGDFWLKIEGDSMEPHFPDGSLVLIRQQPQVEQGEVAAVLVQGDNTATLKKVAFGDGEVILQSFNPRMPLLKYPANEVSIIGKVVYPEVIRKK